MKKYAKITLVAAFALVLSLCFCSCGGGADESATEEYSGPSVTDLIEYDVPDGFFEWTYSQAGVNGPTVAVEYAEKPEDEATESCLDVALLKCDGKATVLGGDGQDDVSLEEEMADTEYEKTVDIDGETGYITRAEVEGTDDKTLEVTFEHDDSRFCVMMDVPVTAEREAAFYELVESIRFK